jgi:cytochrome c biogenesis protein CcmG/thiol:disulfide interchange protein DsbE
MSKRRIAALAAVIIVPIALLAIVLASLLDDDGSGKRASAPPPAAVTTGQGESGESAPSHPSERSGTGGAGAPKGPLPVLDAGSPPKQLSDKLAPASSGGSLSLDDLRGTPIVLNLWSSSCTPCRGETRVLESEWERLGRRGVLFLGLNVMDSAPAARRFREQYGVTYPSVEDERAATARSLGAIGVPETFFISKTGKVVSHVVGAVALPQIELGVRAAQTGEARPTDQGGGQIPLR